MHHTTVFRGGLPYGPIRTAATFILVSGLVLASGLMSVLAE